MADEPEWLTRAGPKRILALDGGGVRGIVSIAFLKEMERQLRQETGRSDLVLADVFDFIIGTSVGSMLATMLALGHDLEFVEAKFREIAPKIFDGRMTIFGQKRFSAVPLVNGVRSIAKGATLESPEIQTGLGIVAKRADTGSVWVLTNNPRMPYWHDGADYDGNRHYKLESLIRASTAAPFLFTPTEFTIHTNRFGKEDKGTFVDGGVSPHNTPALLALMLAGLPSYKMNWTLSPEQLLIISVGTGLHRSPINRDQKVLRGLIGATLRSALGKTASDIEEAAFAANALRSMVSDGTFFAIKTMQALSQPRFSWKLNTEIYGLDGEFLIDTFLNTVAGEDPDRPRSLCRFQRYDLALEARAMVDPEYDVSADKKTRARFHAIDDPTLLNDLHDLAAEAAGKQVSIQDFEGFV